ncbi:MAG: two-component sensor histidine kinase, partial [Selenomonadales bacterium]|nr:two-component sensor histidine kinase [Selenomonadales bacterium]
MSGIVWGLSMTGKILQSILSVAVAVLISSLIIITGVLYQYFGNMQEDQLKDELKVVASATEQLGESYLSSLKSDRYRLTWIDADGVVRFDSRADISTMENHAEREEIKEAIAFGTGSSVRQSSTLTEQTIYEATRLNDGSILRISVSRATALVLVLGMIPPIAIILIVAIM